jgi:type 1 glutamine amidotransferase
LKRESQHECRSRFGTHEITVTISLLEKSALTVRRSSKFTTTAWLALVLSVGEATVSSAKPAADPGVDCPSAHTPYTSRTILLDLLINPATRSVLERDEPELLQGLPDLITRTTTPTFAAIVDIEWVAASRKQPLSAARLATLDGDLSVVPVTEAAARARCARYDDGPSPLPATVRKPSMLVFSKVTGARDESAVSAAAAAFREIGSSKGWTTEFTENGAAINEADLNHFSLVVWNNVSGDVLTTSQRAALRRYIENGGGFAAVHGSGGDFLYGWDWYADTLIGARFIGHPRSPGFQAAAVIVDDPDNWVTRGLPPMWSMTEEWYSFKSSPRLTGAHILARLDESTYDPTEEGVDIHMGDHPIAWTRCVGNGRSFYTAIGHRPESYVEPHVRILLERGIVWAAGQGPTSCQEGKEMPRPPVARSP